MRGRRGDRRHLGHGRGEPRQRLERHGVRARRGRGQGGDAVLVRRVRGLPATAAAEEVVDLELHVRAALGRDRQLEREHEVLADVGRRPAGQLDHRFVGEAAAPPPKPRAGQRAVGARDAHDALRQQQHQHGERRHDDRGAIGEAVPPHRALLAALAKACCVRDPRRDRRRRRPAFAAALARSSPCLQLRLQRRRLRVLLPLVIVLEVLVRILLHREVAVDVIRRPVHQRRPAAHGAGRNDRVRLFPETVLLLVLRDVGPWLRRFAEARGVRIPVKKPQSTTRE